MIVPRVMVVVTMCAKKKQAFGIRFEELAASQWAATWAFPIQAAVAKREGYDRTELRGAFAFAESYPGCPFCLARSIVKCPCGKVACWDSDVRTVVCPWCGHQGQLEGSLESVRSAKDR